ncbi:MAG: SUMF1/EgtB/PvdO family nonheme iron enzyme [Chloroflexota bacterium]
MAFNVETWKQALQERLQNWRPRLLQSGVESVYAFLAAAALWPAAAAFRSGDVAGAYIALGAVIGNVSANLLANLIQQVKDEATAARQVESRLSDQSLRRELDELLDRLAVLPTARQGLAETDRAWFNQTLQSELARLGNLPRFQAVFAGQVIVTIKGDNNSVTTIINQYVGQGGQAADDDRLRQQIANYLAWLAEDSGTITLRGIKREDQQVVELSLDTVYVPLEADVYTWPAGQRPRQEGGAPPAFRTIALDQILTLGRRVVITGGPGCGKSTVLQHVAHTLAVALAADDSALVEQKLGLRGELPLPILLPLSRFATHLRTLARQTTLTQAHEVTLAAYISRHLIETQTSFGLPADFFERLLQDGRAVILLLDGLDEVPDEALRVRVVQAIEQLVTGRDTMRVVVTCRTAAYQGRSALGKDFRQVRVRPLDETHVERLVRQAYTSVFPHDPDEQQRQADALWQGIAHLEAERQRRLGKEAERLVTSPLLVRMLLIVHFSQRRLPEQRAELYVRATDVLLWPDYTREAAGAEELSQQVGGDWVRHRDLLQHLAFHLHQRGEQQGRELAEDELRRLLRANATDASLVDGFIAHTRQRGTLLEERGGLYRFIHLGFQEYLAARYLAEVVRGEGGVPAMVAFLESGPILDSWWREPALLTAGYLSLNSGPTAQSFLRRLAGLDSQVTDLSPDGQLAAAEIAATACAEWQAEGSPLWSELAGRLASLFENAELLNQTRPTRRAAAGVALASLGDPRPGVRYCDDMRLCFVPPGEFWLGDEEKDTKGHWNNSLDKPYWLARFPVTVAQFRQFIQASGHKPRHGGRPLQAPDNWPVASVNWYDALAFGDWLDHRWRQRGWLPAGYRVTLPSEAEWEKAARGGRVIPAEPQVVTVVDLQEALANPPATRPNERDGRDLTRRAYPWGDELEQEEVYPLPGRGRKLPSPSEGEGLGEGVILYRANNENAGIGDRCAVGSFPAGLSPHGCLDMSGQVWEWTRSFWGKRYPYRPTREFETVDPRNQKDMVLRGGAYYRDQNGCSVRDRLDPRFSFRDDLGVRVCVSPFTSGL